MRSPEEYQKELLKQLPKPRVWGYNCIVHRILRWFGLVKYEFETDLPSGKTIQYEGYERHEVLQYASITLESIGYHDHTTSIITERCFITKKTTGSFYFSIRDKQWHFMDHTPIIYSSP